MAIALCAFWQLLFVLFELKSVKTFYPKIALKKICLSF